MTGEKRMNMIKNVHDIIYCRKKVKGEETCWNNC